MAILIKGIDMPTAQQGYITVRIYYEGTCVRPNWQGDCTVIKGAEASKVPTPHGRLIDADELLRRKCDAYDSRGHFLYAVGMGNIVTAPTIIEAED